MDEFKAVLEDELPPEQSSVRWDHLTSVAKNRDRLTSSQMCFVKTTLLLDKKLNHLQTPFTKFLTSPKVSSCVLIILMFSSENVFQWTETFCQRLKVQRVWTDVLMNLTPLSTVPTNLKLRHLYFKINRSQRMFLCSRVTLLWTQISQKQVWPHL